MVIIRKTTFNRLNEGLTSLFSKTQSGFPKPVVQTMKHSEKSVDGAPQINMLACLCVACKVTCAKFLPWLAHGQFEHSTLIFSLYLPLHMLPCVAIGCLRMLGNSVSGRCQEPMDLLEAELTFIFKD